MLWKRIAAEYLCLASPNYLEYELTIEYKGPVQMKTKLKISGYFIGHPALKPLWYAAAAPEKKGSYQVLLKDRQGKILNLAPLEVQ